MKLKYFILLTFIISGCAYSPYSVLYSDCEFPRDQIYPGGLINYELKLQSDDIEIKEVMIADDLDYLVCKSKSSLINIIIPIPLSFEKSKVTFSVANLFKTTIDIEEKLYRESRINITNQDFVSPPSSMQDRIRQEYLQGLKAKQTISKGNLQNSKMMMPTKGVISSEFGVRRFINDQPRNRHVGLDIAAKEGSPVVAPLKGKVILSENFFYKGNVIYLDHGDGFITSYSHLSKREVIVGQNISKGEILGYVGSTGRVTGPHLHWEVSLLGTLLNPEIFLNL